MSGPDDVTPQIVRFGETEPRDDLFLDNFIGYTRSNFMLVGPNVGWEDERVAPIPAREFVLGMQLLPPGGETALHTHATNEVFVPLNAPLIFYWEGGDGEQNEVELGKWDVISFQAGAWRGIRNDGHADAYVLGLVGGPDGGRATFHPRIVEEAREAGYSLDAEGYRVGTWERRE